MIYIALAYNAIHKMAAIDGAAGLQKINLQVNAEDKQNDIHLRVLDTSPIVSGDHSAATYAACALSDAVLCRCLFPPVAGGAVESDGACLHVCYMALTSSALADAWLLRLTGGGGRGEKE